MQSADPEALPRTIWKLCRELYNNLDIARWALTLTADVFNQMCPQKGHVEDCRRLALHSQSLAHAWVATGLEDLDSQTMVATILPLLSNLEEFHFTSQVEVEVEGYPPWTNPGSEDVLSILERCVLSWGPEMDHVQPHLGFETWKGLKKLRHASIRNSNPQMRTDLAYCQYLISLPSMQSFHGQHLAHFGDLSPSLKELPMSNITRLELINCCLGATDLDRVMSRVKALEVFKYRHRDQGVFHAPECINVLAKHAKHSLVQLSLLVSLETFHGEIDWCWEASTHLTLFARLRELETHVETLLFDGGNLDELLLYDADDGENMTA